MTATGVAVSRGAVDSKISRASYRLPQHAQRSKLAPDLPTMVKAGAPGYDLGALAFRLTSSGPRRRLQSA